MIPLTKERRLLILVNVALVCAQVGFGGFNVVGKYALSNIKPVVFAFYREVISGPLLLAIAAIVERRKPARQDYLRFVLLGTVLYGNQFCFIMGLKLTNSATQTAIMQQCIPVFTTALTCILRMEKLSPAKAAGIVFAVAGAIVMIGFKDFSLDNRTIGMLLLVANTLLMSTYYILQKPLLEKYPPITVTGWAYIVASFSMGLTSLMYVHEESVYIIPVEVIWPLCYAIFVQTIFGYCCVSWANKHAPASLVAVYNSLQPLVAFILGRIFFDELFVWNEGVGIGLVIIGLALVTWARMKESEAQTPTYVQVPQKENSEKSGLLNNLAINMDSESKEWLVAADNSADDKK